ncbi:GH16 domain-containing protein [Plasmodiophora brassicae]
MPSWITSRRLCLVVVALIAPVRSSSSYTRTAAWTPSTFLDQFDFDTDDDPTNGFVDYVDGATASLQNLVPIVNNAQQLRADSTNVVGGSARGRRSIRLQSKQRFNGGLFLLDLAHMPVGCGTWPAYWFLGPNWPSSGEVDVIEGVHNNTWNELTYWTGSKCTQPSARRQTAVSAGQDCLVGTGATGCANLAYTPGAYGADFNANGGGVYATLWDAAGIVTWFFPRGAIPDDIVGNAPRPDLWPIPMANLTFGRTCSPTRFANMQIVFDLTFCGNYAGDPSIWASSGCVQQAPDCATFVRNNPARFAEAYFAVNALNIFQRTGSTRAVSARRPTTARVRAASVKAKSTRASTKRATTFKTTPVKAKSTRAPTRPAGTVRATRPKAKTMRVPITRATSAPAPTDARATTAKSIQATGAFATSSSASTLPGTTTLMLTILGTMTYGIVVG